MLLYPAIDLRGGKCVRLYQGDYGQETVYEDDPVAVAERFASAGAQFIHVVDLDAARGSGDNRPVIGALARAVAPSSKVEVGGGVRDSAAAEALWSAGVARVVVGTAAIENSELVRELAGVGDVAVGIDFRDGEARLRGWTEGSGRPVDELVTQFENSGAAALIVTDIARDGTLAGPDLDGLGRLLETTALDVIASGGVSSLGDIGQLRDLDIGGRRLAGVIVGKALYEGRFTVEEAVAACVA